MTTHATLARLSAAALLGLTVAVSGMAPAFADEQPVKKHVEVDTRTTGSIAEPGKFCDPSAPNADIVCKVTRGDRDATFPSAPVNPPFGF